MNTKTRTIVTVDDKVVSDSTTVVAKTLGYIVELTPQSMRIKGLDGNVRCYRENDKNALEKGPYTWKYGVEQYSEEPREAQVGDWVEIKEEQASYCLTTLRFIDPKEVERRYFAGPSSIKS